MPSRSRSQLLINGSSTQHGNITDWLLYTERKRRNGLRGGDNSTDAGRTHLEVEEKAKHELSPSKKQVYEMTGEGYMHEATDEAIQAEADRANLVVSAVELPASSFSEKGRWVIPLIEVPGVSAVPAIESSIDNEKDRQTKGGRKDDDVV